MELTPSSDKSSLSRRYFFSQGRKATDDYSQFWIRYKPARVLRKRLGVMSKYQAQLNLVLAIMLVALFCASQLAGITQLTIPFVMLSVLSCLMWLRPFLLPTHLTLQDDGLRLHWLRTLLNISSPLVGWDRLSHVSLTETKGLLGKDKALEFNVVSRGMNFRQRLAMSLLAPELTDGWLSSDRSVIRLKLDGIASSDDRKRLQMALKKFLPSYRIDPSVNSIMSISRRIEGYTDLWLDSLESSGKRIRSDMLSENTQICQGRYEIVGQIGGGGQAVVYEALEKTAAGQGEVHTHSVVLKEFVLPAHAGVNVRKRVLANIQREAEMLKNLNHANVVQLLDFFVDDQRAYLVLEHIEGSTLKRHVQKDGPLSEPQVIELGIQMCDILVYLHSRTPPVVHRDFTPDNLILSSDQRLKVIDFNVAQHLEADETRSVVGKHAFIPPEQFRGEANEQSDIYALGGTLYFLLTGDEPEPITKAAARSKNSHISPELDFIIGHATEQATKDRYKDCAGMSTELKNLRASQTASEQTNDPAPGKD